MSQIPQTAAPRAAGSDEALLESLGYRQELKRRMGGFSNFAISFAIICILGGGISAFPQAIGAGGGISVGLGWPLGSLFALVVAASMAQIASAFPTAGGLYHWSSILGGKGWGWATAWFNLLGLIFGVASIDFGVYDPFFKTLVAPLMGLDPTQMGTGFQIGFIAAVAGSQALLAAYFPRFATRLISASGYLILGLAVLLIGSLLVFSHSFEPARLFTYTNMTGLEGSSWPHAGNGILVFLSGLLLTVYTISGFDASAHTSEETRNAARVVPKGILTSVLWSAIFGFVMIATFVMVMPPLPEAVKAGFGFFGAILAPLPPALRAFLAVGILVVNFLSGLASLTSTSRMMYAFSRDGGLPASSFLKIVSSKLQTPTHSIWICAILLVATTLYGDAFVVLSTGCAVLLYLSYIMPIGAGILAEGKTWVSKGPFDLKGFSIPVALLAVLGGSVLAVVGMQPPNQKVLYLVAAMSALLLAFWWVFGLRKSFQGPPNLPSHEAMTSRAVEGEFAEG